MSNLPTIILKLDDLVEDVVPERKFAKRWQRCISMLTERKIKCSAGIVGFALEDPSPWFVNWIQTHHASGQVEFWNHGYHPRQASDPIGEFEGPFEQQRIALHRTQQLGREKLGITFRTFGPHWTTVNADTAAAMKTVPDIKIWFDGPESPDGQWASLKRSMQMELEGFQPDIASIKSQFDMKARGRSYLMLQGHPPHWDDAKFNAFVQIIDFLQQQECLFATPLGFVSSRASTSAV